MLKMLPLDKSTGTSSSLLRTNLCIDSDTLFKSLKPSWKKVKGKALRELIFWKRQKPRRRQDQYLTHQVYQALLFQSPLPPLQVAFQPNLLLSLNKPHLKMSLQNKKRLRSLMMPRTSS
jgi:hypothetical protein